MARHPLLIIGRRDALSLADAPGGPEVYRKLAQLTRQGYQLVSAASLTNDWSKNEAVSSRSHPRPRGLRQLIEEAGGALDAVYYVPHSLLTQKTRRETALRDLLARFAVAADECFLFSSSRKFVAVAESLGIHAEAITEQRPLKVLLDDLSADD
ncbi:MAG: hypothetical protein P8Y54_00355 [Xanthomonadales bacterium]